MIRFIDLFAGIGGFHYGIDRADELATSGRQRQSQLESTEVVANSPSQRPEQSTFTCVYSNEWDKYANSVYKKHFGECDNRDIRTVPTSDIPDFDLLCGGFPCQSFSVAGKRGGFNDTRGTMFFEIARILKDKRPRYLLLENVKGLLSHDSGKTFQTILGVLTDLGYDVQWQVLNSKDFGVPQNRERIYIIGHLRGTNRPEVFPLTSTNSKDIVQLNQPRHSNDRIYGESGLSPTLNTMQGGRRQPKITRQPLRFLDRNQKNVDGKYSFTLDQSNTGGVRIDTQIRRLTPTECMRLQGFPDSWCDYGVNGEVISDSQKYKMAGNAVTTNVVSVVVSRLFKGEKSE